jgi:gliding motility-associated-like protein
MILFDQISFVKRTVFLIFILITLEINAQNSNVWMMNTDFYDISFDFNIEPPELNVAQPIIDKGEKLSGESSYPSSICDTKGKLLVYSREYIFYNARSPYDSAVLPFASDTFIQEIDQRVPFRFDYSGALPTDRPDIYTVIISVSFWFTNLKDTAFYTSKITRYIVTLNIKDKLTILKLELLPYVSYTHLSSSLDYSNYNFQALPQPNSNKIWLLFNGAKDSFFLVTYDKTNGLIGERKTYRLLGYYGFRAPSISLSSFAFSNNGKHLVLSGFSGNKDYLQKASKEGYSLTNACYQFNFDSERGIIDTVNVRHLFETNETITVKAGTQLEAVGPRYIIGKPVFSPNDSIIYILAQERMSSGGSHPLLFQINLADLRLEIYDLPDRHLNCDLKLGPNGMLYLLPYKTFLTNISVIKRPNIFGPNCQFENWTGTLDGLIGSPIAGTYTVLNSYWPNFSEPYKRATFISDDPKCSKAVAQFTNTSDSIHWERYRFYFGDGDSADMDDQTSLKDGAWGVEHIYKNPGKYFVKLRACNAAGGWVWYSDSITVLPSPVAKFSLTDTTGCQWIAYRFKNESLVFPKGKAISYHWQFGDNTDTLFDNNTAVFTHPPMQHTYTKNGIYTVTLIVNDGFCMDTFALQNTVEILAAPRPGISVNSERGCTPFELKVDRKYTDATDSLRWNFGDGSPVVTLRQAQGNALTYTYNLPGNYLLSQTLFGSTGCITTDTLAIKVEQGFDSDYIPELISASIENRNEVEVNWKENPVAKEYNLYRNETQVATVSEIFYKETYQTPAATYTVRAVNVCNEESRESNPGRLIHLAGTQQENNLALVEWTAYEEWPQGVASYILEAYTEGPNSTGIGDFKALNVLGTEIRNTEDPEYRQDMAAQKCYRITAISTSDQDIISHSNTLCLPYTPVFFVPTAFSPNGDGLNDAFVPYSLGMSNFTMRIFNRWGEKIFEGQNWDGKIKEVTVMPGSYQYVIEGKTIEGLNLHAKGSVVLVR